MDVIRASTSLALRAAEEQLSGRLGQEVEEIRSHLLRTVAHVEAYIDFPDEGILPHTGERLLAEIDIIQGRVQRLLATANEGRILREGVHLVICGAPNAGKSSLPASSTSTSCHGRTSRSSAITGWRIASAAASGSEIGRSSRLIAS